MEHKFKHAIAVGYTLTEDSNDVEDVHLIIPSLERAVTYRAASRGKDSSKLPVCGAVANFITKNSESLVDPVFVGFGLPSFLSVLGLGCARSSSYLCPSVWLPMGKEEKFDLLPVLGDSPATVLSSLGAQFSGEDKKSFDKLTKSWKPYKDAEIDGKLALLLGSLFRVWG